MDADLKAQADALFTELGMNLTTAFKVPLYLFPWPSVRNFIRKKQKINIDGKVERQYSEY